MKYVTLNQKSFLKYTIISFLFLVLISCGSDSESVARSCSSLVSTDTVGYNESLVRPNDYQLVFCDEFDSGTSPDSTKWTYDLGSPLFDGSVWGNGERQHYTSDSENVYIRSGNLVIQAKHETPAGSAGGVIATSARLKSATTEYYDAIGSTPYGYYEIRAKISCTSGSWPAIWLLGKDRDWPSRGEIDIMEWSQSYNPSDKFSSAIHTQANHGGNYRGDSLTYDGLCQSFQKFQLHWVENKVIIGINGKNVFTYNKPDNATIDNWPFTQPAYILLNVAVGGTLGGDVNIADIANMNMMVDYVRVWSGNSSQTIETNLPTSVVFPITFEGDAKLYEFTGFDGGYASVFENPQKTATNNSDKVARMVKNDGQSWAGSFLSLDSAINFSSDTIFTMKTWSNRSVRVLFKIEGSENENAIEKEVSHTGSGWENLSFDLPTDVSVFDSDPATKITIIFDNGTNGAFETDESNWTFYVDDIIQVE